MRARFEGGFCPAGCGMRIHTGDEIAYDQDREGFVHAECVTRPPMVGPVRCTVCGRDKPCRCEED